MHVVPTLSVEQNMRPLKSFQFNTSFHENSVDRCDQFPPSSFPYFASSFSVFLWLSSKPPSFKSSSRKLERSTLRTLR
jgi:hypothetical protein